MMQFSQSNRSISSKIESMTKLNQITHPIHRHKLKLEYTKMPFTCDGCKELGIGSHYTCSLCDFDLHRHCATPAPWLKHPFFRQCTFQFLLTPPKNIVCDACFKDVTGFVYHCKCGYDLHPSCARLPTVLDVGDSKLYLHKKLSKSCNKCGRSNRRGWSYRPENKEFQLDVGCVKEMIEENWHEGFENGNNNGALVTAIPNLNNMLQAHRPSGNKFEKYCELAGLALQALIGLLLGDPTPLIAVVVRALKK